MIVIDCDNYIPLAHRNKRINILFSLQIYNTYLKQNSLNALTVLKATTLVLLRTNEIRNLNKKLSWKDKRKGTGKTWLPRYMHDRISFASPRVFADTIRGRQSLRFAHWIMKEGPKRWKWTLDLRSSFFRELLSADPLDLRPDIATIDLDATMQDLRDTSCINHWSVLYILHKTQQKKTLAQKDDTV